MRRLILMRHAKSDWSNSDWSDHERPLNGRGQKSAPQIGQRLLQLGWCPDGVRSSDSARTTETWELMADHFDCLDVRFSEGLYLAGPQQILEVAAGLPADVECGLILGHNPGMSMAASALAGRQLDLKTADAALLEADGEDWSVATDFQAWTLVDFIRARALTG